MVRHTWRRGNGCQDGCDSHNSDCIVVENCRHIFRGELVRRVADQETRLANSTVTDDHASKKRHQVSSESTIIHKCAFGHPAIASQQRGSWSCMQLGIPPREARQVQGACMAAAAMDTSQTDATEGGE